MNKIALIFLLFCSISHVSAQNILNNVTIEELQQTSDDIFPEADAVILDEYGKVYFEYFPKIGFKMIIEVKRKIKVYTQDGVKYVDLSIPHYVGSNVNEQVKIEQVITYNNVNGKIEKSKIKSNAIFDDKKDENWKIKKVIIPDVKAGSIVEYSYRTTTDYFNVIPSWDFQKNIPIKKSIYEVRTPEYFIYTSQMRGNVDLQKESKTETRKLKLSNTDLDRELRMSENYQKYTVTNAKALKEESYIDNIENYRANIQYNLSLISFPEQKVKEISITEKNLIKEIFNNNRFKDQLSQKKYFEKSINLKEYESLDEVDKTKKVLEFVKTRMLWNQHNGYYTADGVKTAFDKKTGNVAEINLMLTSMLRYVGLNANPILVSTINNGEDLSLQKTSFNRVLSCVLVDGKYILLDGTNKYNNYNVVPLSNLNWLGVIVKSADDFVKISMYPDTYSISLENFSITLNDVEKGVASGQGVFMLNNYMGYIGRNRFNGKNETQIATDLEQEYENMDIQGLRLVNQDDVNKDLTLRFSFQKNNVVSKVGDEIYFNPTLFYNLTTNPFKDEERVMPIFFKIPTIHKYNLTFNIPNGYEVDYLPKSKEIIDENVGLKVVYKVEAIDNAKVTCSFQFSKSEVKIPVSSYQNVKQFYAQFLELLQEHIILKKK